MTATRRNLRRLTPLAAAAICLGLATPSAATATVPAAAVPAPVAKDPAAAVSALAAKPSPGSPDSGDSLFPHQGNGGYDVQHYTIDIGWRRSRSIGATTTVTATATQALSAFNLDLRRLRVHSVTVNGTAARFTRAGSELTIRPRKPIANHASFTTVVHYGGRPHWLIDPDGSRDGWIATPDGATALGEPIGSMTWFPNNDTLRDKATYLFRVTAPKALTVESNGRLVSKQTHARTTTWTWRERDEMASYLASISIGRYDVVHASTASRLRVDSYLDPRIPRGRKAAAQVPRVLAYWASLFGPYPFTSSGIVVDNVAVDFALEVQTRPVFAFTPDTLTLVHELAHQWYGDSVTPRDWSDIWLNEGFATYAEWLWTARKHRGYPHREFLRLYNGHDAQDPFWHTAVAEPGSGANLFGDPVYTRGAMALEALRTQIGSKTFFRLLKRWPTLHRESGATTGALQRMAERLSGQDLDGFFHDWLYTAAKPASP